MKVRTPSTPWHGFPWRWAIWQGLALLWVPTASAQEPAPAGSSSASPDQPVAISPPADPRLDEAKELFRRGNALLKADNTAGALEQYLRSRALVPSIPNTLNAAICLDTLGRFDEALDLYEELIATFRNELAEEDRQLVARAMTRMRRLVGSIDISSNVDGIVVVDSRMRGRLPLSAEVRVLPGEHRVRVVKDGYESSETTVIVQTGQTVAIDARLRPLAAAGRLRVDDESLKGAAFYLDGAFLGAVPWEGTVAPGEHLVQVIQGQHGSAPVIARAVQGQTVAVALTMAPLGPQFTIAVEPDEARLFIDGVPVGERRWTGRLPMGKRVVAARADGYEPSSATLDVAEQPLGTVAVHLVVDPGHPRWGAKESGRFWVEAFGLGAWGTTFRGGAETWCDAGTCTSHDGPSGWFAGGRAGYEFPIGLSLTLGAAYFQAASAVRREFTEVAGGVQYTFVVDDELRMAGPIGLVGLGWRWQLGAGFDTALRFEAGVAALDVQDRITGHVRSELDQAPTVVGNSGKPVRSAGLLLLPGASVGWWLGDLRFALDLSIAWMATEGPRFDTAAVWVATDACPAQSPSAAACAPSTDAVSNETSFGHFVLWTPGIDVRYSF